MSAPETPEAILLRALPDEPRWVDVRGLLAREGTRAVPSGDGWVVAVPFLPLVLVVGAAAAADVRREADALAAPVHCAEEDAPRWVSALPGRRATSLALLVLDADRAVPDVPGCRLLAHEETTLLADVPPALRAELTDAMARGPVAASFDGARPVSFCYAHHVTERWWDASIDTLASHRRRGHAVAAAAFLIRHLRTAGLEPVWGAEDSNPGSRRTAERLGFRPVARFALLRPA